MADLLYPAPAGQDTIVKQKPLHQAQHSSERGFCHSQTMKTVNHDMLKSVFPYHPRGIPEMG